MGLENHEIVYQFEIFKNLNRPTIDRALTNASLRQFKHREFILRAGDPAEFFCIVLDGAAKLIRHSPRGEDLIMHFAVQGDLVGALVMNQGPGSVFPVSAKSMGPTRVLCIPKATYREYWLPQAEIQTALNALLYKRMSTIQDDKTLSTSPLRTRLASFLLRHVDRDSDDGSQALSLALTRQEIADSLGVAVESVIRIMRDWLEDGTIQRQSEKGPEFIDIKKLLESVES